jgi:hypothetical protein
MPLLYAIEVTPGNNRLAWYVPIYWSEGSGESDETIYLAGFAIVDAQDTNKIASTINQEGITSEQLVRQTRLEYAKLFGANVTTNIRISANVLKNYEYVQDGTTHIILHLNNTTYPWIEATPKDLSPQQWNELISTQPGQAIFAQIEERDGRWMTTDFGNQSSP